MHKHFPGIQLGLWDMIWFCDYYGVISLFIIKSYFRGLLMILKRKSLQTSNWQNISRREIVFFFLINVSMGYFNYQTPKLNVNFLDQDDIFVLM